MKLVAVPEILRQKLGPEAAQALVDLLNESSRLIGDETLTLTLAEQRFERRLAEEIGKLRGDLGAFEGRMGEAMSGLEARMGEAMGSLEARMGEAMGSLEARVSERMRALEQNISAGQTRALRWMVGVSLTELALLSGLVLAVLKVVW